MGYEDDGAAISLKASDVVQALALKVKVAHGEHLVDQQHVGLHVDGDREGQPHVHARGVRAQGVVDLLLQLRESHDRVEAALDIGAGKPQQRRVQVHVLTARVLELKPRTQLEQTASAPANCDTPAVGRQDAGHQLQGGALAGAVAPDQAQRGPAVDVQVDVDEGPVVLPFAQAAVDDDLLQGRVPDAIDPVLLGNALETDGRLADQTASGRCERSRTKKA